MLVRFGPQVQEVLRRTPDRRPWLNPPVTRSWRRRWPTWPASTRTWPPRLGAGFSSLTWGEGLTAVTGHGLADFLWYQLPTKWVCDLDEKHQVAAALGDLFHRLGRTRYADMCGSPATADILATYEHDGGTPGSKPTGPR
jgi:hypothetical protein